VSVHVPLLLGIIGVIPDASVSRGATSINVMSRNTILGGLGLNVIIVSSISSC